MKKINKKKQVKKTVKPVKKQKAEKRVKTTFYPTATLFKKLKDDSKKTDMTLASFISFVLEKVLK